jgi:hypothetical protein
VGKRGSKKHIDREREQEITFPHKIEIQGDINGEREGQNTHTHAHTDSNR